MLEEMNYYREKKNTNTWW